MIEFKKLDKTVHDRKSFSCGVPELDDFLKKFAAQNQAAGYSTTHVLVDSDEPAVILGYVTLSTAELDCAHLTDEDRRHFPRYPIPAIRVARLAVALHARNKGYGKGLLGFCIKQVVRVREAVGVRLLVVDAKDEDAAMFYKRFGFVESTKSPLCLYMCV